MKKNVVILLLLTLIFPAPILSQTDTMFVENIINMQVMETRQKKHNELLGNTIENPLPTAAEKVGENINEKDKVGSSNGLTTKITILASASAGLFLLVFVRRKKLSGGYDEKKLKKNIKMMREEKVIQLNDTKMKKTRELIANEKLNFTSENVSQVARQLKISKGELQLAARLMQRATNNFNNKNFA